MSLRAQQLAFNFAKTKVLDDISFALTPHKLTAIMGLNGAGKTTLLKLLSGFYPPQSGQVFLHQIALASYKRLDLAREISVVPQDFPTEFPFSVQEFVMMGLYPHKKTFFDTTHDLQKVQSILAQLTLTQDANRPLDSLSGGERQRVLLARALVQNTPIILLDEPLNHLDIKYRAQMLKTLQALCQNEKKTIVAIMHHVEEVQTHFDEVILLHKGKLKFFGNTKEAFTPEMFEQVFETESKDAL